MKAITEGLQANFDRGWKMLEELIDICPDVLWNRKAGGYIFWQQIYHCFACVDFFIAPKGISPDTGSWDMDVAMLKVEPSTLAGKAEIKAYGAKMKAKADEWIATLDDAALAQPHEGFSARREAPMNNVMVISGMLGHSMYHIGHCDAILRENGEKGVM